MMGSGFFDEVIILRRIGHPDESAPRPVGVPPRSRNRETVRPSIVEPTVNRRDHKLGSSTSSLQSPIAPWS